MNRWRKLLVLWLLCVTMPLQAMAALRTHCTPETSASAMQSATTAAENDAAASMAMRHAMTMSAQGDAMPGMHHHDSAAPDDATSHPMAHQDASRDHASSDSNTHSHYTSCSACAACVVCTALPPSVVIRKPDAQPSTAIPFLRTSVASAVVAVLERPPKALAA
ncbi:hypothetical protein [Pandoraea communis]|uniref:Uncharacterized protein n=1 Tax=Pandoraea communis TaxID=2508297 RepID=A0A5E4RY23_9BURK|nr:hypothetical protein [Pandoraea communis]MDM8355301.1 hypothetical protein [Pandoraea communis]VVD67721.1 hypothetical protein PCO31111_00452 [Pandoraea communis]